MMNQNKLPGNTLAAFNVNRQEALARSVGILLSVINSVKVEAVHPVLAETTMTTVLEADASSRHTLQTTLITACDRLDSLIKDDALWTMKGHDELLDALTQQAQAATEYHRQAEEETKLRRRPALLFGRRFSTDVNTGLVTLRGAGISGTGRSAVEAMNAYDRAFYESKQNPPLTQDDNAS